MKRQVQSPAEIASIQPSFSTGSCSYRRQRCDCHRSLLCPPCLCFLLFSLAVPRAPLHHTTKHHVMDGDDRTRVCDPRAPSGSHYSYHSHNGPYSEATHEPPHSSMASSFARDSSFAAVPWQHLHHLPRPSSPAHIRHSTISSVAHTPHSRVSSAGHYGPHADETPYAMLAAVIGRASARDLRTVIGKERTERRMIVENERPPNIQTRRRSKVIFPTDHGRSTSETSFKLLMFDRRTLTTVPIPPPPVDHILDPPKDGDFFSSSMPPPEKVGWYNSIPRSSSAPSVPHLARERRGSNASLISAASADTHLSAQRTVPNARQPHDHDASHIIRYNPFDPLVSSPESATFGHYPPTPQTHQATLGIRQSEPHGRYNTFELMAHDSAGVTSYLDPDLTATFHKRMAESSSSRKSDGDARVMSLSTKMGVSSGNAWVGGSRRKDVFSESEWTFEKPILKAMGEAVRDKVGMIKEVDHYHVAE